MDELAQLEIRDDGRVSFDGIAVGNVETEGDRTVLIVNLGWARAAGLGIRVLDDPAVERHRNGITLER